MKNFDELFNAATKVADHRKKVFNELIEATKKDILPKFCNACEGFDIRRVYFKTSTKTFQEQDKQQADYDEYIFALSVNVKEQTISEADFNPFEGEYYPKDDQYDFEEINILRVGAVEFVKLLNNRLDNYIQKYEQKNTEAKNLINS